MQRPSKCSQSSSSSQSSRLSTRELWEVVDRLKWQKHRDSTRKNYYQVWKQFACFFQRLDYKPFQWEDRIVLFVGHLVNEKKQSSTVKSYLSAIRAVLKTDGVELNEDMFLVNALTRACKIKNDKIKQRKPITKGLLNRLVNEARAYFESPEINQMYLSKLYQTLFSTAYYGLFRIGELTSGSHPILAKDVMVADDKKKLRFDLHSSKTHGENNRIQYVKISSTDVRKTKQPDPNCPYKLVREFGKLRGPYTNKAEPFFVFQDHTPVKPIHMSHCLKFLLHRIGEHPNYFSVHSFRAGRSNDLLKLGLSVETIKKLGRWKSNAVFRYLR